MSRGRRSLAGGQTDGTDGSVEENASRKKFGEILGWGWKTSFFFFLVPLFSNVETTQCEEEDRTQRQREETLSSARSERRGQQIGISGKTRDA